MMTTLPVDRIESLNLIRHGTKPSVLTAANVIQCAEADLRALEFNKELKRTRMELKEQRLSTKHTGPARQYTFVRRHVTEGKSPAGIIALAVEGLVDGAGSNSISTARIYSDVNLLYAALKLAEHD